MKKKENKPLSKNEGDFVLKREKSKNEFFNSEEREEETELGYKDKDKGFYLKTNSSESFKIFLNSAVVVGAMYISQNPWIIVIALAFYFSSLIKLK